MSRLPTLLVKGNLKAYNGDATLQKKLDNIVPIEYIYDWIRTRESLEGPENRVLVLKSQVASGKSTALLAGLYITFLHGHRGPGLICSQPRVLTAIKNVQSIAREPSYEQYLKMGKTIGWSTGSNKLLVPSFGVLSCTIGTLAMILKSNIDSDISRRYKFIMIDEFHERDLETDITVMLLKKFVERNKNSKSCPFIILMSATLEPEVPLKFFGINIATNYIFVEGRSYGTTEVWKFTESAPNLIEAALHTVRDIVKENTNDEPEKSDILIFMPGSQEIKTLVSGLERLNADLLNNKQPLMSISILDSASVNADKLDARKLLMPLTEHTIYIKGVKVPQVPLRRVVVGTNVAETGVTIDSLKYVIDSGIHRGTEYYPFYDVNILITKPASKSRIIQRRGRVGRKQPGFFYPLYPKYIYDMLQDQQLPNIFLDNISPIILTVINAQTKFEVKDIDMLDVPSVDALTTSLKRALSIGFLTVKDGAYEISELGLLASQFMKMAPESIRMIFAGYYWKCSILDLVGIASYLTFSARDFALDSKKEIQWLEIYKMALPNIFKSGDEPESTIYKYKLLIADDFINGCIFVAAFKNRITADNNILNIVTEWCERININFERVILYLQTRNEFLEQCISNGLNIIGNEEFAISSATPASFESIITQLKRCIYEGYRCNVLSLDEKTQKYYTTTGLEIVTPQLLSRNEENHIRDKKMQVKLLTKPKNLIYNKLTMRYKTKNRQFEISTDAISTLDGYVALDPSANLKITSAK